MLNIETVLDKVTVVDSYDFENFVNNAFPELKNKYEFAATLEYAGNYCLYLCENIISNDTSVKRSDITTQSHYKNILRVLCAEGLIPAGNYLINIGK